MFLFRITSYEQMIFIIVFRFEGILLLSALNEQIYNAENEQVPVENEKHEKSDNHGKNKI